MVQPVISSAEQPIYVAIASPPVVNAKNQVDGISTSQPNNLSATQVIAPPIASPQMAQSQPNIDSQLKLGKQLDGSLAAKLAQNLSSTSSILKKPAKPGTGKLNE